MDAQSGTAQFREADQLFREAKYAEALALLEQLNQHYPEEKNLLYPMAVCLAKLGRGDEALALCERLIQRFDHEKARRLKSALMETVRQQQNAQRTVVLHAPPGTPNLPPPTLPRQAVAGAPPPADAPASSGITPDFSAAQQKPFPGRSPVPGTPAPRRLAVLIGLVLFLLLVVGVGAVVVALGLR